MVPEGAEITNTVNIGCVEKVMAAAAPNS